MGGGGQGVRVLFLVYCKSPAVVQPTLTGPSPKIILTHSYASACVWGRGVGQREGGEGGPGFMTHILRQSHFYNPDAFLISIAPI